MLTLFRITVVDDNVVLNVLRGDIFLVGIHARVVYPLEESLQSIVLRVESCVDRGILKLREELICHGIASHEIVVPVE